MARHDERFAAVFAGAMTGLLVLGLGGRAATAALAVLSGGAANVSLPGLLESIAVGVVLGAAGGLLMLAVRRALPQASWWRGLVLGAVLFHFCLVFGWFSGRLALRPELPPLLILVAAAFLVYGLLLEWMLRSRTRLSSQFSSGGPTPS